jgi:hypothetical protein
VYIIARAIQRQEGWSRRRSLLAAMKLKGIPAEELRRIEDRIRNRTLAQVVKQISRALGGSFGVIGRVPV